MTSLLSAVSGQFAKSIVLGTLFPVLIFCILSLVFVGPLFQPATFLDQLARIALGEDKWAIVAMTFVVLVLTGVLQNLNLRIIRLYEGYPWKGSWIGQLFSKRKRNRLQKAAPLRKDLRSYRRKLADNLTEKDHLSALQSQQTMLALYLNSDLPDQENFVLPTRFGNVIRCFERYSTLAYGMDAIVLWPRLVAKIDSGFATTIEEAKISLDFMLNCSFLSTLISLLIVTMKLSGSVRLTWDTTFSWLWRVALFVILAIVFYEFAIGQARSWGQQVRSAFDLYRFDLLKSLGYEQHPSFYEEERALWQKISRQLLFADSREAPLPYNDPLQYKDQPTRVIAPVSAHVEVSRSLKKIEPNGMIPVEITVTNQDPKSPVNNVRILETIPEGYTYVLHSLLTPVEIEVSNLKPLQFACKSIAAGAELTIRYALKQASV